MPLKAAPVWALLGPGKEHPESWGVRVENLATAGLTKMYIYGEIGYWGVESMDVIEALREISGPVEVHINSMGGSVWEGLAIYQALCEHPHDVTVVIDGLAASAASFIAMAGRTIEIGPAAHMMIHNAAAFCYGDADVFEAQATMLRNCTNAIATLYAKRSGGNVDDFIAAMAAETWYIGQEAVNAGLADAVRGEETDAPDLPENARRTPVFNLAKLPDPPAMRGNGGDGPDSREEEQRRERPIETDGNTPTKLAVSAGPPLPQGTLAKAMGICETPTVQQPPKNSSPGEGGLFGHLVATRGLFDHLTEGAAQ